MNRYAFTLVAAFLLFLWAAGVAADKINYGTHAVLVDLGLAFVAAYFFLVGWRRTGTN